MYDICENGVPRNFTPEEAEQHAKMKRLEAIAESKRPLTASEVSEMIVKASINNLAVDDTTALRMRSFYPEWELGVDYPVAHKVNHEGELYKCLQAHTAQIGREPSVALSLWVRIDETHTGTLDDPIPYNGNMALENGKHYIEGDKIYLCNRDTVNPVYNPLSELVNLYVMEV